MRLVFELDHPDVNQDDCWIATLSDGKTVVQDAIPFEHSTWYRMAKYLKDKTDAKIQKLCLHFLGKVVTILDQADGFFFGNREEGLLGGPSKRFKGIGYVKDMVAYVTWITPDGIKEEVINCITDDPRIILH